METLLSNLALIIIFLITGLLLVKLILFFAFRTKNWTLTNLFYFDLAHITLTESNKRASVKRWQNTLTVIIVILILIQIWMRTMFHVT